MYPWTSTDHTLYMCTHTTRTTCTLSHGLVVREYNVSMDIHRSFIVCVYTHNKDHSLYVCTYMSMYMSHGWVVREYNNFFTTIIMSLKAE